MTYKWDAEEVRNYANVTANTLCDDIYTDRDAVSGDDILEITPVRQVNLLIIKEVYERWQEEIRRLKSPYFDYQNPEVQYALDEFMNVLSQFISIKRKEFEPILIEAIQNALRLSLAPEIFFEKILRNLPNFRLTADWLNENRKYIVQNRFVLDELTQKVTTSSTIYANEAILWAKEIIKQKGNESPSEIMELFNKVQAISEGLTVKDDFVLEKNEIKKIENNGRKSFFDNVVEEQIVEKKRPENRELPPEYIAPSPIIEQKQEILVEEKPIVVEKSKEIRLNEQHLETAAKTLNDRVTLASSAVSDYHRLSKIESMRSAISVNQRYLFINNLFGGNVEAFSHALDEIDLLKSFAEARELLLKKYVPRYLWDVTSAEAEEFFDILKRRFS